MTKKFEVTFHMNSGKEIGTLIEADSEQQAQIIITTGLERNHFALADDLVILPKHVEYFYIAERED
jgi:hypothetical protein